MKETENAGKKFERLVKILDILRGEEGCPWDREQDERSIANYFLEEAYETIDAISSDKAEALAEELGDVLMEVVFLARIYREKGFKRESHRSRPIVPCKLAGLDKIRPVGAYFM